MDLTNWRKHIDQVVKDEGQWVGLLDENLLPILDFPPVVSLTAPKTRHQASSCEVVVDVTDGGGRKLMAELVGDGLGQLDEEKRLTPNDGPTRFVCVVRDGERVAYTVTHSVVEGAASPTTLTVHGVDLLDGLAWWPCPSSTSEWRSAKFQVWSQDASWIRYAKPRELARVKFIGTAIETTKRGKARDLIRNTIQDSFDAVNGLMGWSDPHAFVDFDGGVDTSPQTGIRLDDSSVWDTLGQTAAQTGVEIEVDVWWPGDVPVTVRGGTRRSWPYPVQIVRVTHE